MSLESYALDSADQALLQNHKDPAIQYALMQGYLTPELAVNLKPDEISQLSLPDAAKNQIRQAKQAYDAGIDVTKSSTQLATAAVATTVTATADVAQLQRDITPTSPPKTESNPQLKQAPGSPQNLAHIGQDIFGEGDRTGEIQYYMRALLGGYISNTQLQEAAQAKAPTKPEKFILFASGVTPADWIRKAGISRQNLVQMMEVQDKHLERALKQPSTNPVYKKVIADEKLALRSLILELGKTSLDEGKLYTAMQTYETKITARIAKLQPSVTPRTPNSGPVDLRAAPTHEARNIGGLIKDLEAKITTTTAEATKAQSKVTLYTAIDAHYATTPPPATPWHKDPTLKTQASALGMKDGDMKKITATNIAAELLNATNAHTKLSDKLTALNTAKTAAETIKTHPPKNGADAQAKYGALDRAVQDLKTNHTTDVTGVFKDAPAMKAEAEAAKAKIESLLKDADTQRSMILADLHNELKQTLKDGVDAGRTQSEIKSSLQLDIDATNQKLAHLGNTLGVELGNIDSKYMKEYIRSNGRFARSASWLNDKPGAFFDKIESKAGMRWLGVGIIGMAGVSIATHDTWDTRGKAAADIGLSMIPGVGAVHDIYRIKQGTDLNGNELSGWDQLTRGLFAAANSLNFAGLIAKGAARAGVGGVRASQIAIVGTRSAQLITYGTLGALVAFTGIDIARVATS